MTELCVKYPFADFTDAAAADKQQQLTAANNAAEGQQQQQNKANKKRSKGKTIPFTKCHLGEIWIWQNISCKRSFSLAKVGPIFKEWTSKHKMDLL